MKIGRNEPCPCGSGKKYKKCCLGLGSPETERRGPNPESLRAALEILRQKQAEESVRIQQQGHGHPIVSFVDHGYRLVAVGSTIYWDKGWTVFPDFLLYFLKRTFNFEWGVREKPKGLHPLFRWLEKFTAYSASQVSGGKVIAAPPKGFLACWMHLAYSIYLIQHNDSLPKSLIRRLRDPQYFLPAFYETLVGAALVVAGFEISCAETSASSEPVPEFFAKSKHSGKVFCVEAKRKNGWKAPTADVSSAEFQSELERYIRDQVHAASKKKLLNGIYWFELSIPSLLSEADWRVIVVKVKSVLRDVEKTMTVDREAIKPAFVVVTNYTFLANEDIDGQPAFAALDTVNVSDCPIGGMVEIEAALEAYDSYKDIFLMMDAWKIAQVVPTTFDGSPPELLSPDGEPMKAIRIGGLVQVPDCSGRVVSARIIDVVTVGRTATAIVEANGERWFSTIPLTDGELAAAARFTDAVFGKNDVPAHLNMSDPIDLYQFFQRTYSGISEERVNEIFKENPWLGQLEGMSLQDARRRICREYTKAFWARHDTQ